MPNDRLKSFIILVTFLLCDLCVHGWQDKPIVKTVYPDQQPNTLYTSIGGVSNTRFPAPYDGLFLSHWNHFSPGITSRSAPITPSFVTGAQVHAANRFHGARLSSKPRRWVVSTAYDPPLKYKEFDDEYEIDDTDEGNEMTSDELANSEASIKEVTSDHFARDDMMDNEETRGNGTSEYVASDDMTNNEVTSNEETSDEENTDMEYPIEPTIINQEDVDEVTSTEATYESGDDIIRPEVHESETRVHHDYLPETEEPMEYQPTAGDSYKVVMEEEHHEPVRSVRRSTSPWPYRDKDRLGAPRHPSCNLPLDRGVGPDELSSWYYDVNESRCRWFGYQGHGGNANRFYSRIACEAYCVEDLEDLCQAVTCPSPGLACKLVGDEPCKENEDRYGRDWRLKCPPDHPVCLSPRNTRIAPDVSYKPIPPECFQPKDGGSCQRKNPAVNFYYDSERNACMTFYFHNCGGNDNRFDAKADCMTHCSP